MARKKKKQPEDDGGADFMMLFTALMIILLAFFILLSSMGVVDDQKKRMAFGSLMGSFGILPGGTMFDASGSAMVSSGHISDDPTILQKMLADVKVMLESQNNALDDKPSGLKLDETGMYPRLMLSNGVLYSPGGRTVSPNGFPVLDRIAKAAKDLHAEVLVEGHTAAVPPPAASRVPSNWELSTYRAVNVGRYLVEAAHLPAEDVQVVGYGDQRGNPKPADQVIIVFLYATPDDLKGKGSKR